MYISYIIYINMYLSNIMTFLKMIIIKIHLVLYIYIFFILLSVILTVFGSVCTSCGHDMVHPGH